MPQPSATTTKPSLPPTAPARQPRKRTRACARATSRCTANKSRRQDYGWGTKQPRLPTPLTAMPCLLHVGEGYAMLGDRKQCEAALGAAEAQLQAMGAADPAPGLLSADRLRRIQGSRFLALRASAQRR